MTDSLPSNNQIQTVTNFHDLVSTPFRGENNALCWTRELIGDFSEIVKKIDFDGNMVELGEEKLRALQLSEQGNIAREILITDIKLLKAHGAIILFF